MPDDILQYIKESVDRIESKQDKHADRINEVEKWQANATGKMTVIGGLCGAIGALVVGAMEYFRH